MQTTTKSYRTREATSPIDRRGLSHEGHRAQMSDESLVREVLEGRTEAFGELYERHRRAVHTAVAARISGSELQHDIVQEAFTTALAKLDTLATPSLFRAWVLQIGRNASIDNLRLRQRRGITESLEELLVPPVSPDPDPSLIAELHQLETEVSLGLLSLNKRDATVLGLSLHFGLGPADMAEVLGVTPNNAKVILHRARRRLRSVIEDQAAAS